MENLKHFMQTLKSLELGNVNMYASLRSMALYKNKNTKPDSLRLGDLSKPPRLQHKQCFQFLHLKHCYEQG